MSTGSEALASVGVPIQRRVEITGIAEVTSSVDVALSVGWPLQAQHLVGGDGGTRSPSAR